MTEKKYELTDETIAIHDRTLHRIQALKDFCGVNAGELGGWIEREENLSHDGMCWVYDEAKVFGAAIVCENAHILEESQVYEHAWVGADAIVMGNSKVCGASTVGGNVKIRGEAKIIRQIINGNARFSHTPIDYIVIGPIGSRYDYATFYTSVDHNIWVETGCFVGTIETFERAVQNAHGRLSPFRKEYTLAIKMAKNVLKIKKGICNPF